MINKFDMNLKFKSKIEEQLCEMMLMEEYNKDNCYVLIGI